MKRICLGALAVLTVVHSPASATAFQVVITGILAPGAQDISDYLGQGVDLSGKQAELIYTFDTNFGVSHPFGNSNWDEIYDQGLNPANTLTIKIGTTTLSPPTTFNGNTSERIDKSTYYTYGPPSGDINGAILTFLPGGIFLGSQFSYAFAGARLFPSADLASPFSVSGNSPYTSGEPIEAFFSGVTNSNDDGSQSISFGGSLIPSTITVQSGPVPEPSTWAMMLIGLGAIGLTVRVHFKTEPHRTDGFALDR